MTMHWRGVIPAMTTAFRDDLSVDHDFLAKHAAWMVDSGCAGIVALGSLGEGATLTEPEKRTILQTVVKAVGQRVPVAAGISALGTAAIVPGFIFILLVQRHLVRGLTLGSLKE